MKFVEGRKGNEEKRRDGKILDLLLMQKHPALSRL